MVFVRVVLPMDAGSVKLFDAPSEHRRMERASER